MPLTKISKKNNDVILDQVLYIYYLIQFKKNKVQSLIDSSSKDNLMTLAYTLKLGLKICFTDVKAQKIDDFIFEIFEMILRSF